MNPEQLAALHAELQTLTDVELASLIVERVDAEVVATLLGEEVLRRLTALRAHRRPHPAWHMVPN